MKLTSESFDHDSPIPSVCAFCIPDQDNHAALGQNRNPALSWSDVPEGTKSLVLLCHDSDVPRKPDNVNKEGKKISKRLKRMDFFHWVLVDVPGDAVGRSSAGRTTGLRDVDRLAAREPEAVVRM